MAVAVAVGVTLAMPGASLAQAPGQDSVVLTSGPARAGSYVVNELNATSGPSGENPTGQVRFDVIFLVSPLAGPVTCLAVRGDTATINFRDQASSFIVTVQVSEAVPSIGQPDAFDAFPAGRAPTDCSPLPPSSFGAVLESGNITIVDAPPLPTAREQCKNGGWRNFPGFKNQGDCVSFVATRGRNRPAGP